MADRSLPKIETGEKKNKNEKTKQQQQKPQERIVCTKAGDVKDVESWKNGDVFVGPGMRCGRNAAMVENCARWSGCIL